MTNEQRGQVVAIAKTWIGTRYRGWSHVKGPKGGVDCGMLLKAVYQEAGLIPAGDLGINMSYSLQVAQHLDDTSYIDKILEFFHEIPQSEAKAGDLVVYKLGLAFAHGGIIVSWPRLIHAIAHGGVRATSGYTHPKLAGHVKKFYTLGVL
jgi:cell wall-associated NlpC family hydrolase